MHIVAQWIVVDLDKQNSMYNFSVNFYLLNGQAGLQTAPYRFDKVKRKVDAKNTRLSSEPIYLGPGEPQITSGISSAYDGMTGKKAGIYVAAQVKLVSSGSDSFDVSVTAIKEGNTAQMTYDGGKPAWLHMNKPIGGFMFVGNVTDFTKR